MAKELRLGMWVLVDGKVGTLQRFTRQNVAAEGEAPAFVDGAEVHLADRPKGETTLVLPFVANAALAQASFNDIPEDRRPDEEMARALGYL